MLITEAQHAITDTQRSEASPIQPTGPLAVTADTNELFTRLSGGGTGGFLLTYNTQFLCVTHI